MDGLTAKVFRTYNASITLQQQVKELTCREWQQLKFCVVELWSFKVELNVAVTLCFAALHKKYCNGADGPVTNVSYL